MNTNQKAWLSNLFVVLRIAFGLFLLAMTILADSAWVRLLCLSSAVLLIHRAYSVIVRSKQNELE
ncbi:hypothetical protein BLX24_14785 [Arsenicibacter rosenii]|uniref:Uncharacterized protein n=1 Tax=Arsenicibacter rosenii TaxID=1750698 RepID=A0A1S2VJ51_9BACT|nr:hypothetical protein BLX24_14785 [Arsenicibacter rosenii]